MKYFLFYCGNNINKTKFGYIVIVYSSSLILLKDKFDLICSQKISQNNKISVSSDSIAIFWIYRFKNNI